MNEWSAVDQYFEKHLLNSDSNSIFENIRKANRAAGLPQIDVSPLQGKQLDLLTRLCQAKRILEVGTLGGYSTTWMARAMPASGRIVTLEIDPHHAEVAQKNFAAAGVGDRVEVRVGPAIESLKKLEGSEPFDLFFIDADKKSNPEYFEWALKLSRKGSLIVVDNVVRGGAVANALTTDVNVQGVRRLIEMVGREKRVEATAIQTVGDKAYDGFLMAVVVS